MWSDSSHHPHEVLLHLTWAQKDNTPVVLSWPDPPDECWAPPSDSITEILVSCLSTDDCTDCSVCLWSCWRRSSWVFISLIIWCVSIICLLLFSDSVCVHSIQVFSAALLFDIFHWFDWNWASFSDEWKICFLTRFSITYNKCFIWNSQSKMTFAPSGEQRNNWCNSAFKMHYHIELMKMFQPSCKSVQSGIYSKWKYDAILEYRTELPLFQNYRSTNLYNNKK